MTERLKGQFMGCSYHDDDYEACIQYSGQAPCNPPDGWQMVPLEPTGEMLVAGLRQRYEEGGTRGVYCAMLAAAPKPGGDS